MITTYVTLLLLLLILSCVQIYEVIRITLTFNFSNLQGCNLTCDQTTAKFYGKIFLLLNLYESKI